MKVVLHAEVKGLGNRGDIVDVSDGYARNALLPKGLAQQATAGVTTQAEAMKRAWIQKNSQEREAAEELATSLVSRTIKLNARASGEGKLFGSVTATDIAEAIKQQTGTVLDRKTIKIDEPIRSTGLTSVIVAPHADVAFPVSIEVLPV